LRFVHTADWQLGMRRHFLGPGPQDRFSQDRLEAVAAIGRLAKEVEAAAVVVAGDVFDDNQVDRQTVLRAMEVLRGFPDVPVLLLPGNHDPLDAGSVFSRPEFHDACPPHVQVVTDQTPLHLAGGVELVGAPWPVKRPLRNPALEVLEDLQPTAGVRILLAHGGVDVVGGDFDQTGILPLEVLEAAIHDHRVQFVALGDRHSATEVGTTGRIWYPGAPEPTAYVEQEPGKALVVEVEDGRVNVERRQVGRWTFRQEVFDVGGGADLETVLRWLEAPRDKAHTIAKIALRGTLTLAERTRLEGALEAAAATYAALESWERHQDLTTSPDQDDLEAMEVGGFVADAVTELREVAAGSGADAEAAGDALALLYRTVVRG
jgi:DNA repair exonuclease SbcCD nuclease subunit